MDPLYSLLVYGLLLYFFKVHPKSPQIFAFPRNILHGFIFLPLWLHSLLALSKKRKSLYAFLWVTIVLWVSQFGHFFPHLPYAYYLETFSFILSNSSLLLYVLYLGLFFSPPPPQKEERKEDESPYEEVLIVLKNDPGFLSIPATSVRSVRNLQKKVYVIPKESFFSLNPQNIEKWCPWYKESKIIEDYLKSLQHELRTTQSKLLTLAEENNQAVQAIEKLQLQCSELEKTRNQLLKDIQKMRSESRLHQVSDLYRLTSEELEKMKENKIQEVKIIDQILFVRRSSGEENH